MSIYFKTDLINFGNSVTERPDPSEFERHCHQKYELLYIAQGKGKCIVEGNEYPLSGGSLFIFRPFEYHYVCPDPDVVYDRCVCNFDESILMPAVRELPMMDAKNQSVYFCGDAVSDNFCNVKSTIEAFLKTSDAKSPQSEALTIAAINQLLLLLSCEEKIQADPDGNELVSRIIEYFNENLDKKISLDETAKRFFISKYYLCRLFRRHTGGTVLAYLNSKRIAMAQHLISSGEPPTSVFYAVGFRDYSSFYRAYVKETGKPPSASR